jgi:hypothetical protein
MNIKSHSIQNYNRLYAFKLLHNIKTTIDVHI